MFLWRRARDFLKRSVGPVLHYAQLDCTPASAPLRCRVDTPVGTITRCGEETVEVLLQKAWIYGTLTKDGELQCLPLFRDPQLTDSTDHWHYATAATNHFEDLLQHKPKDIVCRAWCLDEAAFESTTRVLEQWQDAFIENTYAEGAKRWWRNILTFEVGVPCALHGCAGGVRWMVKQQVPEDKELSVGFLKQIHLGIGRGLIKSFNLLWYGFDTLMRILVWEDSDPADIPRIVDFWKRLGCQII